MHAIEKYISIDELKPFYLYRIEARNASFGIWLPNTFEFAISRIKFGKNFVFEEIHHDASDSFGTVYPLEEIEQSPFRKVDFESVIIKDFWVLPMEKEILDYLNRFENRKGGVG